MPVNKPNNFVLVLPVRVPSLSVLGPDVTIQGCEIYQLNVPKVAILVITSASISGLTYSLQGD